MNFVFFVHLSSASMWSWWVVVVLVVVVVVVGVVASTSSNAHATVTRGMNAAAPFYQSRLDNGAAAPAINMMALHAAHEHRLGTPPRGVAHVDVVMRGGSVNSAHVDDEATLRDGGVVDAYVVRTNAFQHALRPSNRSMDVWRHVVSGSFDSVRHDGSLVRVPTAGWVSDTETALRGSGDVVEVCLTRNSTNFLVNVGTLVMQRRISSRHAPPSMPNVVYLES